MGRWGNALILAAVLLVGCASVQNTPPQQDRAWAAYEACKAAGRVTHWQLDRVEPDGRTSWNTTSSPYGFQEIEACMREELAKRK